MVAEYLAMEWAEAQGYYEKDGIWYDTDGNEVDIVEEYEQDV